MGLRHALAATLTVTSRVTLVVGIVAVAGCRSASVPDLGDSPTLLVHITAGVFAGQDVHLLEPGSLPQDSRISVLPQVPVVWPRIPVPFAICVAKDAQREQVRTSIRRFNHTVGIDLLTEMPSSGNCETRAGAARQDDSILAVRVGRWSAGAEEHGLPRFGRARLQTFCRDLECTVKDVVSGEIELFTTSDSATLEAILEGGVLHHEIMHAFGLVHHCVTPSLVYSADSERARRRCSALSARLALPDPRISRALTPWDVAALLYASGMKT